MTQIYQGVLRLGLQMAFWNNFKKFAEYLPVIQYQVSQVKEVIQGPANFSVVYIVSS